MKYFPSTHNLRFPYVFQFLEEWNRGAIFVRTSVKVRKNCQKFDLYNLSKQYKSSTSAMDQNTPDRQDLRNRLASSQRFLINQLIQLKHWNWNTQSTPGVNSILVNIILNPSQAFFVQSTLRKMVHLVYSFGTIKMPDLIGHHSMYYTRHL